MLWKTSNLVVLFETVMTETYVVKTLYTYVNSFDLFRKG